MQTPGGRMIVDAKSYKDAFSSYLRTGLPIERALKQAHQTTYYVWRTREDDKVRSSHAENNGQVFSWDDPPPTGHPGTDYGCRCTAEPYEPSLQERLVLTLDDVDDEGAAWTSRDFVRHYYRGRGRAVTLRQTGHLRKVVNAYMAEVEERLKRQIARAARQIGEGRFSDDFRRSYDMTRLVFSLGDTTIGGQVMGMVRRQGGALDIAGDIAFRLDDAFVDPLDIGVEAIDLGETLWENVHRPLDDYLRGRPHDPSRLGVQTGEPYDITDAWSGRFEGRIHLAADRSTYG